MQKRKNGKLCPQRLSHQTVVGVPRIPNMRFRLMTFSVERGQRSRILKNTAESLADRSKRIFGKTRSAEVGVLKNIPLHTLQFLTGGRLQPSLNEARTSSRWRENISCKCC